MTKGNLAFFFVVDPPKIVKLAIEHEVAVQQSVYLDCQAEGNPQPTYTWTPCEPQNSVCHESTLHIAEALSDGFYSCQVTNVLSTDTRYTIVCKLVLGSNRSSSITHKALISYVSIQLSVL